MQTYVYLLKPRWLRLYVLWASLILGVTSLAFASPMGGRPLAPPTPGNYVFQDKNQNGIYDGTDTGIQGVRVALYRADGILLETATTTSTGQFSFTSTLQPTTNYDLRIRSADAPQGLKLSAANQGSDDNSDSDASMVGSTAVITATTNGSGQFANFFGFGYQAGDADLILTKGSNVTSVTRGDNAIFTINVSNGGGSTAAGVTVRDTLDAGMTYVSSSPAATTALLGSGQVQLTWGGASTTLGAGEALTFTVTVTANGDGVLTNTAAVTATTPDATPRNNIARACFSVPVKLCQGESYVTSLSANLTNVEWFRNGVSVGTGNSFTIVESGTYSYTSSSGGSDCGTSSCCPIIIYDGSVAPPTLVASSTAICLGQAVSLTASNCAGTLAWSTGDTGASITQSPTVSTIYSVTCTPTAADACPASASIAITVNPAVTATVASATICDGTETTLTANASGGTGFTYAWTPTAAINGSSTGASITANPTATTTYTVTITNATGCSNTATATVTVNPAVTAVVANQTVCNGLSTTLAATATGGSGFTYAWTPTASIVGASNTASVVVAPTTTTTYSVSVTNSDGCSTTTTATVTVNPAVTAVIAVSPSNTICEGSTATLTASGGATYLWSTGATSNTLAVSPTTTTAYTVTATSGDQCVGTASTTITVNPTPVLTVNSLTICQDQEAQLTVGGCTGTLIWSTGTTGAILTVSPLQTTVYSATCALSTGCSATIATTVEVNAAPSVQRENIVATRATCNGGTANGDASISMTNMQNTVRVAISTADGTTVADFNGATPVTGNTITFSSLPNPGQRVTYLMRMYATDGCSNDVFVTLDPAECICPAPRCVPVTIRKIR